MGRGWVFAIGLSVFTAGCVQTPTQPVSISYTDAEFAAYAAKGDSVVFGQAFLRQQGGGVVVCAGEPVVLFPRTPSFERMVELARQRVAPVLAGPSDPRFQKIRRVATCDAQGNFRFRDLPRARWYVFSQVRWTVSDYRQGGELIGEVDTSAGGEHQILLTDANRV